MNYYISELHECIKLDCMLISMRYIKEKLHVLSFILTPFYRRCYFQRILTGFALYREFCCMFCPLTLT
ncbi:hypothetical protein Hanom_Chr11g01015281 [Helianthus anomalus]